MQRDGGTSQCRLAFSLVVGRGLVNVNIESWVNKGLLKVLESLARRYSHYPASKWRHEGCKLTADHESYSFLELSRGGGDGSLAPKTTKSREIGGLLPARVFIAPI